MNKIFKSVAIFALGVVIAGATILSPISSMAKSGDPSRVSGTLASAPCSGSVSVDSTSGSATTNYYGTGATVTASVTLTCSYKRTEYSYYDTKTRTGTAGVTATAERGSSSYTPEHADGYHYVAKPGYTPWEDTTRASR